MDALTLLRQEIDGIDDALLENIAARLRISRKMGALKKENNLPLRQLERERELLDDRRKKALGFGLSADMVENIFRILLAESLRLQEGKVDTPNEK